MKWRDWLEKWQMSSIKIKTSFLEMQWKPKDEDKAAAWELYIELLTRITTQPLDEKHGDEKAALASVQALFGITRQVLKNHTRNCIEFTKIAVVVLNQVIRPFTAKWHRLSLEEVFDNPETRTQFRSELAELQIILRNYTRMLAEMAAVEDLTSLEDYENGE